MVPAAASVERFSRDIDALIAPEARLGVAVSGGPDSLALLLLSAAARPGRIEAATVDHALRRESRGEAEAVARLCDQLGVPHEILAVCWEEVPKTAIQERARQERYSLLSRWAKKRPLEAIATAHHLDDQAETLMMRLVRGAGLRGLAAMRSVTTVPGSDILLLRPLLGWRRSELTQICGAAGVRPANDPSNEDHRFERVRVRSELASADWINPRALAASAAHLGEAEVAIQWATRREWAVAVTNGGGEIIYRPSDAPAEIRRRIVQTAVAWLATEGQDTALRGREIDRLIAALATGGVATMRGVLCTGGEEWRFAKAPPRRS